MIEEHWDDIIIYSVKFLVEGKFNQKGKTFDRILVFNSSVDEEEVVQLVYSRFKNISEVLSVDEVTEAMILKD